MINGDKRTAAQSGTIIHNDWNPNATAMIAAITSEANPHTAEKRRVAFGQRRLCSCCLFLARVTERWPALCPGDDIRNRAARPAFDRDALSAPLARLEPIGNRCDELGWRRRVNVEDHALPVLIERDCSPCSWTRLFALVPGATESRHRVRPGRCQLRVEFLLGAPQPS